MWIVWACCVWTGVMNNLTHRSRCPELISRSRTEIFSVSHQKCKHTNETHYIVALRLRSLISTAGQCRASVPGKWLDYRNARLLTTHSILYWNKHHRWLNPAHKKEAKVTFIARKSILISLWWTAPKRAVNSINQDLLSYKGNKYQIHWNNEMQDVNDV